MRTILFTLLALTACSSSSKTEEFCGRADSCNLLDGSVEECVEDLDVLLDDLAPSKRDELLFDVQECLDRPSCGGFSSCIASLRVAPMFSHPALDQTDRIAE
ncbi:MAG: hypothetical protein WKG01_01640 [Kofleriaceae bacterium]